MDTYLNIITWFLSGIIAIGAGVVITACVAFFSWLIIRGSVWVILKLVNQDKQLPDLFDVYTFGICCVLLLPLGYTTFNSIIHSFLDTKRERAYDEGWEVKELRREQFILVRLDPPKHVYVDLKHQATGQLYTGVYVGKHCNTWQTNKIGDTYTIQYKYFVHAESHATKIEFVNMYGTFC